MSNTKTYPFMDILTENEVEVSALPSKTQKQIAKFTSLAADPDADDEELESLDENISINLMDYIEKRDETEKENKRKVKHAEVKTKLKEKTKTSAAVDSLDDVPTAAGKKESSKKKDGEQKTRSLMDIVYGRK